MLYNMHGAIWIKDSSQPINITGNVVYEAYDKSAILVDQSTGNLIQVGAFSLRDLVAGHAGTCPHDSIQFCLPAFAFTSCAQGNLVVNVIKEMAGKSGFDTQMVSCYEIRTQVDIPAQKAALIHPVPPLLERNFLLDASISL